MKYEATVTNVGDFALQLMQTRDTMIIFDKDVPYEYINMVISHTKAELKDDITVGDKLCIAGLEYIVTAVGNEALINLKEKGHCTFVFNGKETVEQPGQIMLKGTGIPRVMVGDVIRFE